MLSWKLTLFYSQNHTSKCSFSVPKHLHTFGIVYKLVSSVSVFYIINITCKVFLITYKVSSIIPMDLLKGVSFFAFHRCEKKRTSFLQAFGICNHSNLAISRRDQGSHEPCSTRTRLYQRMISVFWWPADISNWIVRML